MNSRSSKISIGIIGGSGYVGSNLARYFKSSNKVKVLDIAPLPEELIGEVSYQKCDIRNYNDVFKCLRDIDFVIHTGIIQIPKINDEKKLGYEVNILGTQNICKAVDEISRIKGIILAGSWHVYGEGKYTDIIDEEFGYRPDRVENRARLYVLCKMVQEGIFRYYNKMSEKDFGIIRMGTVLGKRMPEKTAANIFITRGLRGESITPYKHSMYRPMLYVDINDICKAFDLFMNKIIRNKVDGEDNSIVNVCWPNPITIVELAEIIRSSIIRKSKDKIRPEIEIVDKDTPMLYTPDDKASLKLNIKKTEDFLGLKILIDPSKTIDRIIEERI